MAETTSDPKQRGVNKSKTFVEERNGKKISHEGFFYTEYTSREDCEADTKQLIDTIPHKELISGYEIIYSENLQTYVGRLLGPDGKIIEDITKLFDQ